MEDPAVAIRARLDEIAGPDPGAPENALLARLLTSYTTKTPAALDRFAETLHAGDPAAVQDLAHSLKGSAANIGADALTTIFADLEDAAREGDLPPDPAAALDRIRIAYERVAPVCTRIAAELQPRS
ncbi:Hpt domain-containing protein [Actinoplanes sp. NPDC049548]|uniref:Hpt domain-containing protein n=1 Tax=Actinoplanes sp. NPDC049548 TaxID=3155152 RepID=UPI003448B445